MISKFVWPFTGGLLGVVIVFVLAWLAGALFGPLYHNDEDMNRNAVIFLIACAVFMVIGAMVGFRIQRNLASHSSGSAKAPR